GRRHGGTVAERRSPAADWAVRRVSGGRRALPAAARGPPRTGAPPTPAGAATQPYGPALVQLLSDRAPTWLAQMPWLVADDEFDGLRRRVLGSTRDRMLREVGEGVADLAAVRPGVA